MYILKSQGKMARRVRQERRLDFGGQGRGEVAGSAGPVQHMRPPLRACPGAELRLTQLFLAGTPQDKIKAF